MEGNFINVRRGKGVVLLSALMVTYDSPTEKEFMKVKKNVLKSFFTLYYSSAFNKHDIHLKRNCSSMRYENCFPGSWNADRCGFLGGGIDLFWTFAVSVFQICWIFVYSYEFSVLNV